MLFHSDVFLFGFLPIALTVWCCLHRFATVRTAQAWLLAASLVFYGWWEPRAVPLLLASILVNYALGRYLAHPGRPARRAVAVLGVTLNLGGLAFFKYADFGVETWNALTGSHAPLPSPVLPLAISFFTFQQTVYLIDAYRGRQTDHDPLRYALFVTFFPHLIAGPIIHHHELMPQLARTPRKLERHFAVGLTIIAIGLFKKTVLADGLAEFADPVFTAAEQGPVSVAVAWVGTLAFTLQIYFDFSAYSDMAIGVARLFGILMPVNFDSPLKATSIGDLWRRWHMTLSRLLRDYLYFPLGGSRGGLAATCRNLMITMLLCGLWHGAGWNFVLWGGLHGALLSAEHVLRRLRGERPESQRPAIVFLKRVRTTLWLALSFVFFRAESLDAALRICESLAGVDAGAAVVAAAGLKASRALPWIAAGLAIAWFCPNTQQILGRFQPALGYRFRPDPAWPLAGVWRVVQWRPHWAYAAAGAVVFGIALSAMSQAQEFLYFQF